MNTLLILNGAPYGSELTYNGLRLARTLLKTGKTNVRVFLMGDAAAGAHSGQKVPQGYYNIADMLTMLASHSGEVAVCGTCMDARGITDAELIVGARRGTMDQLAEWTLAADKVLTF
ncbi:MAG: DsrE family protein [Sulfuritalea sp.]|nr:DsrE family protein [Sulfuritalea sp.]